MIDFSPERKQEAAESKGADSGSESAAPDDDAASSTASSGFGSLTKKSYGTYRCYAPVGGAV